MLPLIKHSWVHCPSCVKFSRLSCPWTDVFIINTRQHFKPHTPQACFQAAPPHRSLSIPPGPSAAAWAWHLACKTGVIFCVHFRRTETNKALCTCLNFTSVRLKYAKKLSLFCRLDTYAWCDQNCLPWVVHFYATSQYWWSQQSAELRKTLRGSCWCEGIITFLWK